MPSATYETACSLLVNHSEPEWEELDRVETEGWEARTPSVEHWLEDNEAALEAWRQRTERAYCLRSQLNDLTYETSLTLWPESRTLSRLVPLKVIRAESIGDVGEAVVLAPRVVSLQPTFRHVRHTG